MSTLLDAPAAPTPQTPLSKPALGGSERKFTFDLTCCCPVFPALPGNGLHTQGPEVFCALDPAQLLGDISLRTKREMTCTCLLGLQLLPSFRQDQPLLWRARPGSGEMA